MKFPPLPDISKFTYFFTRFTTIDEIEIFYNRRYQFWLYENSHQKDETVKDMKILFFLKFDENGNIINANFSRTTKDILPLTQQDFLEQEMFNLNALIPSQMTLDENKRVEYYRDLLGEKMKKEDLKKEGPKDEKETNPYPEVFKNIEAYLLFDRLYHNKKDTPTLLADFSFIYRRMFKDELLQDYQKPEVFRQWLSKKPYGVILDNKFKTLGNCTTQDKEQGYQSAKLLLQKQKE